MNENPPNPSAPRRQSITPHNLQLRLGLRVLYGISQRIADYTNIFLRVLLALLLITMIVDVSIQVGLRQIDKYMQVSTSSGKTEEMPALLLIWVALLGGSLAVGEEAHLGIDALVRLFPRTLRLVSDQLVHLCMIAFSAVVLLWGGFKLVVFTFQSQQITPAWELPMAYVYLALPLAGFFNLIYLVHLVLKNLIDLFGISLCEDGQISARSTPLVGSE